MFAVIYKFKVKPGQESNFKRAWRDLTLLIYKYEGSLGSRLHKQEEGIYLAYAQWPSREKWNNSGNNMPDSSYKIRQIMRDSCDKIETIHELSVEDDLLKKSPFS